MKYRRLTTKGACYFFTLNLQNRQQTLLTDHIDTLRNTINKVKHNHPFKLDALVILPEHLHILITLPRDDNNYAKRIMLIKTSFSRQLPKEENISKSRKSKRKRGIWQRRYWEHQIRNDEDYENHINYIHYNPVKHGYVNNANEWQYSTIHQYIKQGVITQNWGSENIMLTQDYGERNH